MAATAILLSLGYSSWPAAGFMDNRMKAVVLQAKLGGWFRWRPCDNSRGPEPQGRTKQSG
mgnify:CR=1 FL=1